MSWLNVLGISLGLAMDAFAVSIATGLNLVPVQARSQAEEQIERLTAERADLWCRLRDDHAELGRLAVTSHPGDRRLPDADERIRVRSGE